MLIVEYSPIYQEALTRWNLAVAVLGLVLRQLGEALVPRWLCAERFPHEAKLIKFLDTLLGKIALLVCCSSICQMWDEGRNMGSRFPQ